MKTSEFVLDIENIVKVYDNGVVQTEALRGVNLRVKKGEMLAIMGTSGSGKSTLLNIIGALDSPTDGIVKIENKVAENYHVEPYATKYRSENIGFVFQNYNLLKDLTVEDNIALPLILKNCTFNEQETKVQKMIDLLNLKGFEKNRPIELSGGQQQRVAIGRALISSPSLLLADEPTGNLDYNTSLEVLHILKKMQKQLNQSVIIVTHDPMVATYSDRVIFMHDGKIVDEYLNTSNENDIDIILKKFRKILEDKHDKVNQ